MRRYFLLISLAAFFVSPLFAASELDWRVENVEMHQTETDSISVDIFVNITKERIRRKSALVLQGFLMVGEETIPLKAASFYTVDPEGKTYRVRRDYTTASGFSDELFFAAGKATGKFCLHSIIPIPPGLDACTVLVMLSERTWPDRSTILSAQEVAHFYYRLKPKVEPLFYYLEAPDDRAEQHIERFDLRLEFPKGKDVYSPSLGMNEKSMFDFCTDVSSILTDKRAIVSNVSFNGYSGIEGSASQNLKTCQTRTQNLMKYLNSKKVFGTYKVNVNWRGEDWKAVDSWVNDSFWGRNQEYHNLIERTKDKDTRERALREQYPDLWNDLKQHLFPSLERYEAVLTYTVSPFSDDESLRRAYYEGHRLLGQYDYFHLMKITEVYSSMWFEILLDWVEAYPYSKSALVNASAAYIASGKLREANRYLRLLSDSDDARYYKSLWFYYNGDLDAAFELASSLSLSVPAYKDYFEQLKEYKNWKFNSFVRPQN